MHVVSPSAKIGSGTVVMASAVINADAEIGNHVIINTNAVVEHDSKISDFVHISPSATLTGAVTSRRRDAYRCRCCYDSKRSNRRMVCYWSWSNIIHDIPANCTAVGVPAKIVRKETIGGV